MNTKRNNKKTGANNPEREDGLTKIAQANAPIPRDFIRRRAYEIHMTRGGGMGQDLDDWLQAEREIKAEMQHASDFSNPGT